MCSKFTFCKSVLTANNSVQTCRRCSRYCWFQTFSNPDGPRAGGEGNQEAGSQRALGEARATHRAHPASPAARPPATSRKQGMVKAPAPVRITSGMPKRFGNAAETCTKHSKLCATSAGDISCISTAISVSPPPGQTQLLAPEEAQGTQIYIFTAGTFRVRGMMSVSLSVKLSLSWQVIDKLEMVTT